MVLSFTTTPTGVQVINERTNDVFDISWDFSVPVKLFIFGIKQILRDNKQYPILTKMEVTVENVPEEEQVRLAASGVLISEIPTKRTVKTPRYYLIDKAIIYRDIFIIEDLTTGTKYRYKLDKHSVFFLEKMRQKKLNSEQAAKHFFEHSELLNEIVLKEDQEKIVEDE